MQVNRYFALTGPISDRESPLKVSVGSSFQKSLFTQATPLKGPYLNKEFPSKGLTPLWSVKKIIVKKFRL